MFVEWWNARSESTIGRPVAERFLGLLIAEERLRPEGQPRELFAYHPQLVLRLGFVEPVDHPDQRADMLLGQLKELLGGLGRHRTNSGRTTTIGHNQPSLCTETKNVAPAAGFLFFWGRKSPGGLWRVRPGLDGFGTGEEFLRRPLDGSPGAKIKFKLGGTFQIFNPAFEHVR